MRLSKHAALLAMGAMAASAMLACHGQLLIGDTGEGGIIGAVGAGSSSGSGTSSGGMTVQTQDGGVIAIAPQTTPVNKLDLLFTIDNSASMGDKQAYLNQALPDLVNRLTTPNCINPSTLAVDGPSTLSTAGAASCAAYVSGDPASQPEFPPVHDMHIGIVSSSLGPRLGDQVGNGLGGVCLAASTITINGATLNNHDDDQAHLVTRSSDPTLPLTAPPTESALGDGSTNPSGFLNWFPAAAANSGASPGADPAITSATQLVTDFSDLVAGVHEYGCGIESQLESWYRFLIQPDPYATLALSSSKAQWVGVDTTIIQQRHDFLRPDSLVAIVDLTDENDSEIDVRSLGGQGYLFMSTSFYPPHATAECSTNPADPACTSEGSSDQTPYGAPNDWGYDLNLRHVHMMEKYGLDPQFPIGRYQNGLLSPSVPDRTGEYPAFADNYVGTNDCTNPLFAASLPTSSALSANVAASETSTDAATLCNLPAGTRTSSLVFFLHIGGVPWQLLHFDPTKTPSENQLSSADWTRIVGNDPLSYDYTGIDPHMIESYQPRTGATAPTFSTAAPLPALSGVGGTSPAETAPEDPTNVTAANAGVPDPYNGREWNTNVGNHIDLKVDREYACIFKLTTPRDCSNVNYVYTVPANGYACDCSSTGLTPDELSPVCDPANPNSQLYAKAYPTERELLLAKMLGSQGLVASICPVDVEDNATADDPLFGYRPAIANLVSRMQPVLAYGQ